MGNQLHGTAARKERAARVRDLAASGHSSRQIAPMVGISLKGLAVLVRDFGITVRADKVIGNTRRIDSNRIVGESVAALDGVLSGLESVEITDLDPGRVTDWATSLSRASRALGALSRRMKK